MTWQRGQISIIFHEGLLYIVDFELSSYLRITPEFQLERAQKAADDDQSLQKDALGLLSNPTMRTDTNTDDLAFEATKDWMWREKSEKIGAWNAKVYSVSGLRISYFMREAMREQLEDAVHAGSDGDASDGEDTFFDTSEDAGSRPPQDLSAQVTSGEPQPEPEVSAESGDDGSLREEFERMEQELLKVSREEGGDEGDGNDLGFDAVATVEPGALVTAETATCTYARYFELSEEEAAKTPHATHVQQLTPTPFCPPRPAPRCLSGLAISHTYAAIQVGVVFFMGAWGPLNGPFWVFSERAGKQKKQEFKASLWMTDTFPMDIDELLPLLETLAPSSKQFQTLKDFFALKLPAGFPVKLEVPFYRVSNQGSPSWVVQRLKRAVYKSLLRDSYAPRLTAAGGERR